MIHTYFVVQDVLTEIKRLQHSRRRCDILQVQNRYLYLTQFLASVFRFITALVPHKTIITSQASFLQALTLQLFGVVANKNINGSLSPKGENA